MSAEQFVFLHASDFRLEEPISLPGPVPDLLRDRVIEAPYRAAEAVFQQAIAEDVDFLILCGDLLDPRGTGPRGPAFLSEWFSRLGEEGIAVFWNAGRSDAADHWPIRVRWPGNVRCFQGARPEAVVHCRGATPLVRLIACRGNPRRLVRLLREPSDPAELFTIALYYGKPPRQLLRRSRVHYWALGGTAGRLGRTLPTGVQVHSPGLPQPRGVNHSGEPGCTLVHVQHSGEMEMVPVATAVVRQIEQPVTAAPGTTLAGLESLLHERLRATAAGTEAELSLVNWIVHCDESLAVQLRNRQAIEQILEMLWERSALETPTVWSVGVTPHCHVAPAPTSEHDRSLRGEFLRQVEQVASAEEPLDLAAYLPEAFDETLLANLGQLSSQQACRQVLEEARVLGAALLTGEEPEP